MQDDVKKIVKSWPMPEPEVRMQGTVKDKDGNIKKS
jgi:hypothetical protein